MEDKTKSNIDFLSILRSLKPKNNPFKTYSPFNLTDDYSTYNLYGFKEDLYDFEIKCPICYGRVSIAKRPENCIHIFCGPCIKKWAKTKKKCPCCRTEFNKILSVDYSEPWIREKYA